MKMPAIHLLRLLIDKSCFSAERNDGLTRHGQSRSNIQSHFFESLVVENDISMLEDEFRFWVFFGLFVPFLWGETFEPPKKKKKSESLSEYCSQDRL